METFPSESVHRIVREAFVFEAPHS
jgi:hypothetical protein